MSGSVKNCTAEQQVLRKGHKNLIWHDQQIQHWLRDGVTWTAQQQFERCLTKNPRATTYSQPWFVQRNRTDTEKCLTVNKYVVMTRTKKLEKSIQEQTVKSKNLHFPPKSINAEG